MKTVLPDTASEHVWRYVKAVSRVNLLGAADADVVLIPRELAEVSMIAMAMKWQMWKLTDER